MEKFFAYQKDSRLPCKYGRTCYQKNKDHLDKYKHPPTKVRFYSANTYKTYQTVSQYLYFQEDLRVDNKKKTGKKDVKKQMRLNSQRSQLGESSNVNSRNNSLGDDHADHGMQYSIIIFE